MDLNPPPDLHLGINLYTPHFYSSPAISNNTPGIYLRTSSYLFGVVRNSFGDISHYGAYIIPIKAPVIDTPLDLTLGVITGYKINPAGIPLLSVSKKWNLDNRSAVRATLLHKAISFSMEYSL